MDSTDSTKEKDSIENDSLMNQLLNNNLFLALIIFGITGFIIYLVIKINPGNFINNYSLIAFLSFFILIVIASSLYIFLNIYKKNPTFFEANIINKKNGNIDFFTEKTNKLVNQFIIDVLIIIGFIILFFGIILFLIHIIKTTKNIFLILNTILIGSSIIIGLAIIYELFNNLFFKELEAEGITLGGFIKDIIFFLPCLLIEFIRYIEKELKLTTKPIWILLALELIIILIYFLLPIIIKNIAKNNGVVLLNGPIYTNKNTKLGTFQNLKPNGITKSIYNYNYSISLSLWINPQPRNTNYNYNKFTSLFNYGNKPNILYNGKTNTIKITCKTNKNNLVTIYETDKFPYQTWIDFVIVLRTGIMDIFLNKNLVASMEGIAPYMTSDIVTSGENDGINGGIKNIIYYDKPLNQDQINLISLTNLIN
jgi:hypothetical protein